jgi:hypothetical protein
MKRIRLKLDFTSATLGYGIASRETGWFSRVCT